MNGEPWKCPHAGCPKRIEEADPAVLRVAVSSHLKAHSKLPDGRKGPSGGGKGWLDDIGEAIGDFLSGLTD